MSWDTIVADPEFQALEPDRKQKIANNYFAKNFESDKDFLSLPEEKRFKIKSNFESTLNIEKPLPSRGLFMDVATAPVRGLVNAAETYGRAARTIDPEGGRDFIRDIGTKVVGLTEKVREKVPYIFKPSRESEKGFIRKAITEGTESFTHSLVTGLPGVAVGAVRGIPGMVAGYAASGGALFGLAEYDQFLEEASTAINERKDLTPEEKTALIEKAKPFARKSALVEGGFEFASDLAEGLTMKIGTPFTKMAKGSVRSYLTTTPKQVLLNMAKVASIETPTEMTQAYLETGLRQKAGIDTGLTPKQAAVEVIGPTLFSSVLFGGLGSRFDYKQKQKIRNALIDPKVDIAEREGAINAVAPILSKVNKPFAERWTLNALNSVAQRKPIDIDIPLEKLQKPKATGLKLEQPLKDEVPKFDATPDIKTTGQGLKIEPVVENPAEKKTIVSHEEKILVAGGKPIIPTIPEKPVTLEKPVSKPITEELPTEQTITPERENPSLDRSPKINAIRVDKSKDTKSYADIKSINPNENITIYRAVPKDVKDEVLPGDFVTADKEVAKFYANDLLRRNKTNEVKYISIKVPAGHLKLHPNHQEQGVANEFIYNPQPIKPKGVIASEETKGQEAQRGLPLKPMSFVSVEDARSWIKQKSKEYGGRNQFLASKEYEAAYPEVKRVFDEQKQKNKEQDIEANKVRIKKEEDGTFSLNFIQRPEAYVASGGGLYGGKATYKTEAEAIEKANKLNLTIVPEQGTSPETKGLPTGEAAPVVSKDIEEMTKEEYSQHIEDSELPAKMFLTYEELHKPATHTMPSGEVMPGAEHKETFATKEPKKIPIVKSKQSANKAGKVVDDLLVRRAIDKAKTDTDEYNLDRYSNLNPKTITPAERNDLNMYLFGDTEGRPAEDLLVKPETPATPISPIEANIKKGIQERESLTSRKQLAEQMKQSGMSDEEAETNIQLAVDAPAKALGITPDEFVQSYVGQVKKSTMAELEGKDVTYQPSGLPDDVVVKIETSLTNNVFDDSISTNALRRYGKPHFVTISSSTPKEEAWTRLRKVLIDNPKGYDIVGDRTVLTDKEYLEGKRNKVQYQSQEQAQEFYSHLEDVIEKSSQSRYVPQQLLNYLKAQGVKDAEIEATGLKEYLKEKSNISKDELLEYLKGNQVEIKVIEKGKVKNIPSDLWFVEEGDVEKYTAEKEPDGYNSIVVRANSEEEALSVADRHDKDKLRDGDIVYKNANEISNAGLSSPTKFSQWVEPGGKGYKEILLMLPVMRESGLIKQKRFQADKDFEEGKITRQEQAKIYSEDTQALLSQEIYKSTHYDEPNIVAHIRVDDRTDTNGKKVLFVEEIQSDWATDLKRGKAGVPQFPFSNTWHELALKHLLRYASENGYDSIAWTSGEMQQNRYDLSKQIDSIQYLKDGDKFTIHAIKDGEKVIEKNDIALSELEDLVGKGIANIIVEGKGKKAIMRFGQNVLDGKMLSGLDLKVGGKWAERLYDEMIPQFLNKYTKKWGGKTSETSITTATANIEGKQVGYQSMKVQSLDITPSMRQSVIQEGQPLFQGNRGAIEFTKDGKAIIHILENADKSTFIHEMFHLYVDIMKRTPKLKAQLKILETWIGKPVNKWTVADNEKVAKGGEKYLWEGNAPTSALKAVFERFKTWLREVYKTAKSLDIKLSDDVHKMWDEWFGGKEVMQARKRVPLHKEILEEAQTENIFKQIKAITTNVKIDQSFFDHFDRSELIPIQRQSPGLFSNSKGMPLDEVADGLGISTDELADKLRNALSKKQDAELMTKQIKEYRPPVEMVTVGDLGLKVGDKFKIHGEQYAVKEKDAEGNFLIEDGDKFIVDEFDKIPVPDEGSLKKGKPKYSQPKLLEGEKTDIKPKMETEVQGQKKMFVNADVGGYSELALKKGEGGEGETQTPEEKYPNIPEGLGRLELPELVALAKELLGDFPTLRNNLGKALGAFYPGKGLIKLRRDLAKDPKLAELVLAHEIGHSIDWLPDKTMSRGNILGRIASLRDYLKKLLKEYPKSPNDILTDKDRARLRKQALELAKGEVSEQKIGGEEISPEKILEIWNDIQGKEKNPDLYDFIVRLNEKEKKQILLDAIKGKGLTLPENVQEFKNLDNKKKEIYRKLIRDEIVKRKLYEEEVIRDELKKLTQIWKPFNELQDSDFTKYRYSGKELYADAISVLLNNPKLLADTAPNFYKAFFSYLENKPEVKEAYEAIQNKFGMIPGLRRDVVIQDRIKRIEEGYKRGHEARKGMEERQKGTTETIFDTIMTNLVDEEHADLKRIRKLEKQGETEREIGRKARLSIEELVMIDSKIENLINHFTKEVDIPMRESNITLENLGVYAQASRIKEERGKLDIFNPGGETTESSKEMLEHLQKDWGVEKFGKVKELFEKYWNLRQKYVFPALEEGKRYDPELIEYVKSNMFYSRFSVNKYLIERFGGQITGTIYKQYGTLSEIENPVVATMLQDIMLIRASKINESKLDMIEVLRETKELTPAEIDKSTEFWKPKLPPDPKNYGIFTVMREGKTEHYYVDRQIAESYQYDPYKAKKIAEVVRIISQPFRMLLVTRNPVWMGRNIFRDIKGTVKNLPEMKLRNIPEFVVDYGRGLKESIQDVFGGKRSEDITKLMEGSGLVSGRYYTAKEGDYESKIQELQAEFVISNEEARQAPGAWNKLKRVVRLIDIQLDKAGRISEMSTKVAGYKYLKKHSIKSEREIMHDVRTLIGTPNARRTGRLQWLTNNIFMFSNIGKEGLRSSWESIRTNPTAYIWKTTALNIIPLLTLLGAGAAGVEWIRKILAELSQYDIEGKTIIPTPYTVNGKPVAIGIPEDYQGQIARKLVFRILKMDLKGMLSAFQELNPYQFHPLIKVGQDLYQYYVRSENPRDEFRNMDIIPQRQFKVGGWTASESLLKHSWNELGGKTFLNFSYDEIKEDHKTIEGLKNIFPLNVLGTYLIVSNQGIRQSSYKIQEEINKEYEKKNYAIRQVIIKNINSDQQLRSNRIILSDLYIPMVQNGMINYRDTSPKEFLAKYKQLESKKIRNPYLDSLENANRNEVKESLLNDYLKKLPKKEFRELVFDAVNSSIITREFARGYLIKYNREIQEVMK